MRPRGGKAVCVQYRRCERVENGCTELNTGMAKGDLNYRERPLVAVKVTFALAYIRRSFTWGHRGRN